MSKVLRICLPAVLVAAGAASAEPVLPEGSILYWQSYSGYGEPEPRADNVVASGEDFIVMVDRDYGAESAADYFIEFSGTVLLTCAETMPTVEQRAALAKLMDDGEPGEVVWDLDDRISTKLTGSTTALFMGDSVDVDVVSLSFGTEEDDGYSTETLHVLKSPRTVVEIDFDDGETFDRLMAIRRPANPGTDSMVAPSDLGTCGPLITK